MSPGAVTALLKAPDPYRDYAVPGPGPKTGEGPPPPIPELPLGRNVHVAPLWVSACRCPQCGEVYAHLGLMTDDEPDPPCWRCEASVGVPLSPAEMAVMAEFRRRYDQYVQAIDVGSGKSQAEMRRLFVVGCDSGMVAAPQLLAALERRYGNQDVADVQAYRNDA